MPVTAKPVTADRSNTSVALRKRRTRRRLLPWSLGRSHHVPVARSAQVLQRRSHRESEGGTIAVPRALRSERGQAFVAVVLFLTVIGGSAAIAIDVGSYAAERRDLQNASDAIALAASQELPDAAAARAVANTWAAKNGIDPSSMTVTITQQSLPAEPNPKVKVTIEKSHSFTFARMVGISSAEVQASATAIHTSPAGGAGIVPLSITKEALADVDYGDEVVLKYDANQILTGNTGPLRVDGPGSGNCASSDKYCSGVKYGSENVVCADGVDQTYCDGPSAVDTEPGNKVGATRTAINYRLDNTSTECNDFTDVFEDDPTSSDPDLYSITQECNPFLASSTSSLRVVIIPVINQLCNGSCQVTITGFVLAYLERIGSGGCTGNDCEVVARFARVDQNVGLLAGTFNPNSSNQFVRLAE